MKISVITPTARSDGRLREMALCLAAALLEAQRTRPSLELEWIIVHEEIDLRQEFALAAKFVRAPLTQYRTTEPKRPAHNTARNAGLAVATGDYVAFLNDCNLVTIGWVDYVADCAKHGYGFRCNVEIIKDMAVPPNGKINKGARDAFYDLMPTAVASASWGAPKAAFDQIHGFDLAYDGERKYNDVDAIVRLSRVGVKFMASARAHTIQLMKTKLPDEISTEQAAYHGFNNTKRFTALMRDTARILPSAQDANPNVAPPGPVVSAAPPDAGAAPPGELAAATEPDAPRAREEVEAENALVSDLGIDDDFDCGLFGRDLDGGADA